MPNRIINSYGATAYRNLVVAICLCFAAVLAVHANADAFRTEANVAVELTFHARHVHADPFNEVTLDVVVIDALGRELRVPAFWDGTNMWRARYASSVVGTHRYRTECSDSRDRGLHGISGRIEVRPYTGANPLSRHGPLQVAPSKRYLEHADHTPFFWLGDTWWMGLCHRLHWPDEFQQLAADRKEKGFNVIQIVAGLYPDMPPFDPRGANEAGFPWQTNYASIRPEYFDAADRRIGYLVDKGFAPCIVGAWGYFMPWMGVEKMKAHWRYLIARYGAWPVVWCAAGEANLPWYLAKGFPYDDRAQAHDWTEIMRYVRETDPFHRPLTIHPTAINAFTSRHATDEPGLLDFDMLQTPHGRHEAVPVTVKAVRESYSATPVMPVIDGEASYEMLGDNLPTEWTRRMFWLCLMNGAAGHTYGANGIWQCNRPGEPHGKSPHGGSYGVIPWNEAMRLPGSRQVGFGKKLFEQYSWEQFQPHPEWAAFAGESSALLENAHWIWFPEGQPDRDAPAGKVFCRRTFELPGGKAVKRARVLITADDAFNAKLNGTMIGNGEEWHSVRQFSILPSLLRSGTNLLSVTAENRPTNLPANPAGLIACFEIEFADGGKWSLVSDGEWRCARSEAPGWDAVGFDDASWPRALAVARYGEGPWGRPGPPDDKLYGPQSAGIAGVVRIIYVPESDPIIVHNLGRDAEYAASYFDPVTGEKSDARLAKAGADGEWMCPPPAGNDHDWVVVLANPDAGTRLKGSLK